MFLFAFYVGLGLYLLLIVLGVTHRGFIYRLPEHTRPNVRLALFFLALGLIVSGNYQAYVYYVVKPQLDANKLKKEIQK